MQNIIMKVAQEVSKLIPDCCGVTLGGSRCHNLDDNQSDVEMYFYTHNGAPSLESLNDCLLKLNAKHKRTKEFLWQNEMPWGSHSFFVIDDLYFEIGYRNIDSIKNRIEKYINGDVRPIQDCNDLGLGYMPSGLASSVSAEKILIKDTEELNSLKQLASYFPQNLIKELKKEYFETAKSLINGKLLAAVDREDYFLYEAISNRIIRCLMVMAFALGKMHFPGDKWNEELLLKINWNQKEVFLKLLKEHFIMLDLTKTALLRKREILYAAFEIIEKELKEV